MLFLQCCSLGEGREIPEGRVRFPLKCQAEPCHGPSGQKCQEKQMAVPLTDHLYAVCHINPDKTRRTFCRLVPK
ncbi:hypothetical protein CHARACLAT_029381 [Characodon lateralis]|uniref:Uncharacterized protein n=1 Tax=Characodon lateralis TaxID=208331 RepID=A0ABU7ENC3_9TELE|nr:hypothetical protein [Characodon lateralis]